MLNLIFIFIALISQPGNAKNEIIFPQNRFQIFKQQWRNCNNSKIIEPQIDQFGLPIQIPISHQNPLCIYDQFQFQLSNPITFYYFLFNRTIEQDDLLIITIDGEKYIISQEICADKFVLIRHKQQCYYNSIEFNLISQSKDLGLQTYMILESEKQNVNQYNVVLCQLNLNPLDFYCIGEQYQITQYNLQTNNQKIINSILIYKGILSFQNLRCFASCLHFQVYHFNQQMNCSISDSEGSITFECLIDINQNKDLSQIKDLEFLIFSDYKFKFYMPCFPNRPEIYQTFQTIQQISDNYSSIGNYIQELEFGPQHLINLNYNLTIQHKSSNLIQLSLQPNFSNKCVKEFEEAIITIKNSLGETFRCELSNSNSCLIQIGCLFMINLDLKKNISYIFNLTAIIKRVDVNSPTYQFALFDVLLKDSATIQQPEYNSIFIAILIILSFGIPIILFLFSIFTLNLPLHNSWIREIYNLEYNTESIQSI